MISVTIAAPDLAIAEQWERLSQRTANGFLHPAALEAGSAGAAAPAQVLLAWETGATPARLVGIWALRAKRSLRFGPRVLDALPYAYAFLSTPMVDPDFADAAMAAFLAALATQPGLPKVIWMQDFEAESPAYPALQRAIAAGGLSQQVCWRGEMPVVTGSFGVKHSGSTRKKLRQDWNRLAALGAVEICNAREPAAVAAAMEVFLTLEHAGWKGREGSALLSRPEDAGLARRLIGGLAADGNASVALLQLDGRTVAAQVLLYGGAVAYTWKPAFDEAFARYSPGTLLVDRLSEQLLADGTGKIVSCATEESFMGQLWAGRQPMVDLVLQVTPGRSPVFMLEAAHRRGRQLLREWRDRLQAELRRRRAAATRRRRASS